MKNFVKKSIVLQQTDLHLSDKRKCREFVLAADETAKAGQYLMIRTKNREVGWPYPYFIHQKTKDGLAVLAREDQDLYHSNVGDAVEYWGPRGTAPIDGDQKPILVAEPAVFFAVYPFVCQQAYSRLIITGAKAGAVPISGAKAEYCEEIEAAARLLNQADGPVIAALNPGPANVFAGHTAAARKKSTYLFVSNKKACGIDGCKGCYLHSSETKFGINVCCKGPFMPLSVIDFEADGRCFEAFKEDCIK